MQLFLDEIRPNEKLPEKFVLPSDKQLVRFVYLEESFATYAGKLFSHKLLPPTSYFGRHTTTCGLRFADKKLSFKKYKGHKEAQQFLSPSSEAVCMKLLLMIDPMLGLIVNIKILDPYSIAAPTVEWPLDVNDKSYIYEVHKDRDQQMRLYRTIQASYVSSTILLKARALDKSMKTFYMPFEQMEKDMKELVLLSTIKSALWELVETIQKSPGRIKEYIYEKTIWAQIIFLQSLPAYLAGLFFIAVFLSLY